MNGSFIRMLTISLGTTAACCVAWAEDAVYSCSNSDGSIELLSAPNGANCEKLVSSPDAAPAQAAQGAAQPAGDSAADAGAAVAANGAASAQPAASKMKSATLVPPPPVDQKPRNAVENRLSQYREAMIDQASQVSIDTQQSTGPTSASSRRYLMMNRSTYQQTLGIKPQ